MKTAIAVMMAAISLAVSSAWADNGPSTTTTDASTQTQPVTTTQDQTPPAPTVTIPEAASVPTPDQPVQGLLIKQVRPKLVLAIKSANHWQNLLGRKPLRPLNIWALGSLQHANQLLSHWRHLSRRLYLQQRIAYYLGVIRHWRLVAGIRPLVRTLASTHSGLQGETVRLQQSAESVLRQAAHPPHYADFMCIHRYEGSWTDTGAPYYGGLQMNLSFQASYGGWLLRTKGTADHWTPLEQIWVAERALRSRGFYPWPLTAHYCGLI